MDALNHLNDLKEQIFQFPPDKQVATLASEIEARSLMGVLEVVLLRRLNGPLEE